MCGAIRSRPRCCCWRSPPRRRRSRSGLSLHGVTNSPYQRTRAATAGPGRRRERSQPRPTTRAGPRRQAPGRWRNHLCHRDGAEQAANGGSRCAHACARSDRPFGALSGGVGDACAYTASAPVSRPRDETAASRASISRSSPAEAGYEVVRRSSSRDTPKRSAFTSGIGSRSTAVPSVWRDSLSPRPRRSTRAPYSPSAAIRFPIPA